MAFVELRHVTKLFGQVRAVDDLNLEIEKGEFLAIIGHTGSGKTTLVQHLNGLLHPTSGRVLVDGVDLAGKHVLPGFMHHRVYMVGIRWIWKVG